MSGSTSMNSRSQVRAKRIGSMDLLIAGQAISRGWAVITRNVRHFGRVEGLAVEDWS